MGWMSVMGPCIGCGQVFMFNADHVPSVIVNGVREPVCADCVERVNPQRVANGLEPIVPHPDAYQPQQVS